jgi:ankyrin repeat protein
MPTRQLPASPDLKHLRNQAQDLRAARECGDAQALQRIREFHPRFRKATDTAIRRAEFKLSDAQVTIAREYGFASWARLKAHVGNSQRTDTRLPQHERIQDPLFRHAVDLLDAGDDKGLRELLREHPGLVHQRVVFEGGNYFTNPSLLEFAAENPVRHDRLPPNIVEIARVVLEAGAKADAMSVNMTLALVCSGRVPRECGVQAPLIDLLCDYGADPNSGTGPALTHGEFQAAEALLRRGARMDLPAAAALGRTNDAQKLLAKAGSDERHRALAWAAQHGHTAIVRLLLDAGEDPDRYNPMGCHSHSTPLHQAVIHGHDQVVHLLVEHGARLDIKDILFQGTPLGWAEYAGHTEIAAYLRTQEQVRSKKN